MKNSTISANGVEIRLYGDVMNEEAYISLTDIAKYKNSDDPRVVISNWMSSYSTIDYLAMWEGLYNPDFNRMEFQTVRSEPGRLVMTPTQWIEKMNAIAKMKGVSQNTISKKLRRIKKQLTEMCSRKAV